MITETKKQVTLVIAGRSYPVQIDPIEEREVKTVVAEVNARVESIQSRYPKQDKQDCLAMAILMYASELHKLQHTGELAEMQEAMAAKNLPAVAKELADLLYVVYGTAVSYGVDMDPVFREVHRSNLSKVGGYKREDGKWVKPPTYSPADVGPLLAGQSSGNAAPPSHATVGVQEPEA